MVYWKNDKYFGQSDVLLFTKNPPYNIENKIINNENKFAFAMFLKKTLIINIIPFKYFLLK
jgi:hypothetical protein